MHCIKSDILNLSKKRKKKKISSNPDGYYIKIQLKMTECLCDLLSCRLNKSAQVKI